MKVAAAALLAGIVAANPVELAERQSCPKVYIFGARETTVAQSNGFGTAGGLVNQVKAAYSGAGAEAIVYPACGGQSSCGSVSYDNSASQGTAAVVKAVTAYNQKCPSTQIVLIGYSQGGQIMDNALCGGAGSTLTGNALAAVKAAIFMGDPHNRAGLPYNVGTCTAQGVSHYFTNNHSSVNNITNKVHSFPPAHQASRAHPRRPILSSLTATLPTHTAAMATMPMLINSTLTSMAPRLLLSSRASSLHRSLLRLRHECLEDFLGARRGGVLRCIYHNFGRN